MKRRALLAVVSSVVLAASAAAQADPSPVSDVAGRVWRVTKLIGAEVRNAQNEKIGEIRDLVIDASQERVVCGVISLGGFLGLGHRLHAVPFSSLRRTVDDDRLFLDRKREELEKAPSFDERSWPTFDRDYGTMLCRFWDAEPFWSEPPRDSGARPPEQLGGGERGEKAESAMLARERALTIESTRRASRMIGTAVEDGEGRSLGELRDLVIDDANGRIVYGVLSFGGLLGIRDKLFAVPWGALQPQLRVDRPLVLDVPKERLERAPGFDPKQWPDLADRRVASEVHCYWGRRSYWDDGSSAREPKREQR